MPSKSFRFVAAVAVCLAVALSSAACGEDDEADVRETIEVFFDDDDARRCDVRTDRFLRNSEDESNLAAARRSCLREDDAEDESIKPSEAGATSDVEVDGDQAKARVKLKGGDTDGQQVWFRLRREGDGWKVNLIDGLEIPARLRDRFEQPLREGLSGGSVETSAQASRVKCVLDGLRESLPNERLAEYVGGRHAPGSLDQTWDRAVGKAVTACLKGGARRVIEADAYRVTLPDGWRDLTDMTGPGIEAKLKRGSFSEPKVELVLAEPAKPLGSSAFVVREPDAPADLTIRQSLETIRGQDDLARGPHLTKLGGVDAITYDIASADDPTRERQVIALRDRVAYFITFAAAEDHFDDDVKRFEALLASWRWK